MNLPLFILQSGDAVKARKRALFLLAILCALVGGVWGAFSVLSRASVLLIPIETGTANNRAPSVQLVREVLQSRDFLKSVRQELGISAGIWAPFHLHLVSSQKEGCLELQVSSRADLQETLGYASVAATHLLRCLQQDELRDAKAKSGLLDQRLKQIESELAETEQQLLRRDLAAEGVEGELNQAFQRRSQLSQKKQDLLVQMKSLDLKRKEFASQFLRQSPALLAAREELAKALLKYTEEHPQVKELRAAVAAAESRLKTVNADSLTESNLAQIQLPPGPNDQWNLLKDQQAALKTELAEVEQVQSQFNAELTQLPQKRLEFARLKSRQQSLLKSLQELAPERDKLSLILGSPFNPLEIAGVPFPTRTGQGSQWMASLQCGALGGFLALLLGGLAVSLYDLFSGRIRSPGVLAKATGLPVIAAVGDLARMTESDQEQWAFDTLALLKGRFATATRAPLVCGFISSNPGEGRSTWISLLAKAAKKQGHPVLTISSDSPSETPEWVDVEASSSPSMISESTALSQYQDQPIMNIPIPGKIWDLELRRQWQTALYRWKEIQELIVLVELPPASTPEGVLLSEEFPNLIWLADGSQAKMRETRSRIAVLNHSRAHFGGAVMNRARQMLTLGSILFCFLGSLNNSRAQEVSPKLESPPSLTSSQAKSLAPDSPTGLPENQGPQGSFSVSSPTQLADWQKKLTLGPGDVLNISIYGKPDSARSGLFIGPDGRLTYLQAQDVQAAGLTVEELRAALETALSKYFLAPRITIQPVAFRSKKYYVLGNVSQKGVFMLNRPTTILEAIAQAQGFATTLQDRNTLLLADLSRSFLVRKQTNGLFERMPVDFERLFLGGDLSQNIALAPDDYLYFPPLDLQEIYIIGAVRAPGPLLYTPDVTIMGAISAKGGYIEKAYRQRVLVVRGSLSHPQTFVVDTAAILAARVSDFELKPRDIVYISRRPWAKAEELLELAATEFLRAAVITWTGQNVGSVINY